MMKFLRLYGKYVSPEILVFSWFVVPLIVLMITKSGELTLTSCLIVVAITSYFEIMWSEYRRNGKI